MIITMSPAKILDFKSHISSVDNYQRPVFELEAGELNGILRNLSIEEIARLMRVNPKLALETYGHIHSFGMGKAPQRQSLFAYNGIAYQGLTPTTLDEGMLVFAQQHLILLSGLYGALRPLDTIKPYRLEIGTHLENPKGKTLYAYWTDKITDYLCKQLKIDDNVWINLASNEYAKVINRKKLPESCQIISPQFKEIDGSGLKQVVVYTKKARGMFARFIIENHVNDIEYLKAFDYEGYCFSPELSKGEDWIFIR